MGNQLERRQTAAFLLYLENFSSFSQNHAKSLVNVTRCMYNPHKNNK